MDLPEPIRKDIDAIGGIAGLIDSLPEGKRIKDLNKIFHGLSDKHRLKILMIVNKQPVCVCILKEILNIADSLLSYHLSSLKEHGLIFGKQQGNWIIYYPTKLAQAVIGSINDYESSLGD